jgi:hypothetical protein
LLSILIAHENLHFVKEISLYKIDEFETYIAVTKKVVSLTGGTGKWAPFLYNYFKV